MNNVMDKTEEYKLENENYANQIDELKQKALHFNALKGNYIKSKELYPYSNILLASENTKEKEEMQQELDIFVSNLHNQWEGMYLFCSNEEFRISFFLPSINPVANHHTISSKFGLRRSPFNGEIEFHKGIDFSCPYGADIIATAYGEVICAGRYTLSPSPKAKGFGKVIVIKHWDSGYYTYYAHCSRLYVKVGDWIKRGQIIAAIGSTGASTAPHLHYEIRWKHQARNPAHYLPEQGSNERKFANISVG